MESLTKVMNGLKMYLDEEMIANLTGLDKWIVGAGLSMALDNGVNIFNQLKSNEMIKSLEIINEADEIDVDKIYKYVKEQAMKCPATFNFPLVGAITLHGDDIEKLYMKIKNA